MNIKYPNQVSQIKKHIKKLLPNAAEPRVESYFNIGQSDALIDNERSVDRFLFPYLSFSYIPFTEHNNVFNHSACRTRLSETAQDPHHPSETHNQQHWSRTHF